MSSILQRASLALAVRRAYIKAEREKLGLEALR
jgi:hypothetical protein